MGTSALRSAWTCELPDDLEFHGLAQELRLPNVGHVDRADLRGVLGEDVDQLLVRQPQQRIANWCLADPEHLHQRSTRELLAGRQHQGDDAAA